MADGMRTRTVRVAAAAFLLTLAVVTPFTATIVGDGPVWRDPSVIAALAAIPFIVVAWLWSQPRPERAGQVLIAGLALTAWLFTYLIQGSGYLVGNYAYLAVIVVAAAFLVSVRWTVAISIANVVVIMAVWSTTGLALSDLILSLAYQVIFSVLLIGLARHLERARLDAVGLADEVRLSKEATERVLASTWDSILVIDGGDITDVNRRTEEWVRTWFGRELKLPLAANDLLGGVDGLAQLRDAATGGDAEGEVLVQTPRGERTIMVRVVRAGLLGREAIFLRDVTDERAKQAAEQERIKQDAELQALRGQQEWQRRFMNMASHELRTPLTPIRLQMEMLKDQEDPAVAVMDRSVRRLEALVDDILDVVRLDQEKMPVLVQALDVSTVVSDQAEAWRPVAAKKGLRLDVDVGSGAWVNADPKRVAQILDNMLGNAIKYTQEGSVGLRVISGEEVCLEVTDTGSGFDPSDAERLFEPFTRLEHHLSLEGTGLGMAICRSFATAMGGTLTASSAGLGRGATFTLRLPAV